MFTSVQDVDFNNGKFRNLKHLGSHSQWTIACEIDMHATTIT
jgi:hypothetical protein